MGQVQRLSWATALVVSPLLLLAYFVLYPAYGEIHGADILRSIADDPGRTQVADVCGFAATFLAIPATLALMHVLRPGSPRLATVGGALALTGWIALVGVLMVDVVAVELADRPAEFQQIYENGFTTTLSGVATLHVIGGVVLGVALARTRLVGLVPGVAMTAAPVVHLVSNLAGVLWLDAVAWIVVAGVGAMVARVLLADRAAVTRSG
jgi:hypothetical protein